VLLLPSLVLYVVQLGFLPSRAVIDNFDTNTLPGYEITGSGTGAATETTGQLTLRSSFPGVVTSFIHSSWFGARKIGTDLTLKQGQTVELRVELVRIDAATTNFAALWFGSTSGVYASWKGAECVFLSKWGTGGWGDFIAFFCEKALPGTTNVLMSMALTRQQSDLMLTTRLLDKQHPDRVLFERNVVDTPRADSSLTAAEFQALSGLSLRFVPDVAAYPCFSGSVGLPLFNIPTASSPRGRHFRLPPRA
jgi:hypothetical protein